jgi:hypothetical protein
MTVAERFWEKVGPDECWPWKVCRKKYRYPTFRYNGKNHKAQRIAYLLQHGQIDWKLSVLHRHNLPEWQASIPRISIREHARYVSERSQPSIRLG